MNRRDQRIQNQCRNGVWNNRANGRFLMKEKIGWWVLKLTETIDWDKVDRLNELFAHSEHMALTTYVFAKQSRQVT